MPDAPKPLDHEAIDAVGADVGEGDLSRLLAAVAGGDSGQAEAESPGCAPRARRAFS